jgi:predicted porin
MMLSAQAQADRSDASARANSGPCFSPRKRWQISILSLAGAILLLVCARGAAAQASANISGVITNPSGAAVVSMAEVTADNLDTGLTQSVTSDDTGTYRFVALPLGAYELHVEKQGFNREVRRVDLAGGKNAIVDVSLRAGNVREDVSESSSARTASATQDQAQDDADNGPLTWHGITLYGAYDAGVGWVSHGLPENGYNYEGETLVNRNGYEHRFVIAPNNLQQTGLGVRGKERLGDGWYAVFNASTGINPQSGLLANASQTDIINNGLPRASYSEAIDGSRAGQPFNDEFYGGVSSDRYGTLTFGRQRALGTDEMLVYDPAGGGYAFSYIGYNGTMAGAGDTEDARWDDALKYRVAYGPVHFGAMYKFADGSGGCYTAATVWSATSCTPQAVHNNAYGFDLGGTYHKLSADLVAQHYSDAISVLNPLQGPQSQSSGASLQSTEDSINTNYITGPNLIDTTNTLYGIVTDNYGVMAAAKYAWDPYKFFAGYEYIWQNNPKNPLGVGASDQGGYFMSGVEDQNLDSEKLVQIWWTGMKYTYRTKTDFTFAWYQQRQNDFRFPQNACAPGNFRSSCAGTLNEGSLYVDHHFTKRFDGFAGIAYSYVTGGLEIAIPHGPGVPFDSDNNFAPTIGGRFAF